MPRPLVDLSTLDLSKDVLPEEELRSFIPHRHEFQMIDGICHLDEENGIVVGYKEWDNDPWWARGHIPGRPIMPGVLMAESCAQVSTILMKKVGGWSDAEFIGLGGLDKVRFRGQVVPPARVHYVSKVGIRSGNRLAKYPAQAFHEGKLVLDMELIGVML
ncbi:MAG: 3-hydroxyacyl-ACP dehydratase FabZ family protein [Planctomycetota bacterium]|jgi:3-hydroxyacyl-[acyl-carrier-protein] dehydratase